jgi:GTP-binding protein HflX
MLFATLDPTMRALSLPSGMDIILSDTVGFISDLPTELVASFRATLEEVTAANLVVHVRDISHPETDAQAKDVEAILESLGLATDIPRVELWNKTDLLEPSLFEALSNTAKRIDRVFMLSAKTGTGISLFLNAVSEILTPEKNLTTLTLSFAQGKERAWLFESGVVLSETQSDDSFSLNVKGTARQKKIFTDLYDLRPV